jgi:hypothetical protein
MSDLRVGISTTPEERIAAAKARRQAQADAEALAKSEQMAADLEAVADAEAEHGYDRIIRIDLTGWRPGMGAPTCVAVRVPMAADKLCQRFIEQINRSKEHSRERLTAQDLLGAACIVYPAPNSDAYKAALEVAPLILSHAAMQVVRASQGKAEEEGKE